MELLHPLPEAMLSWRLKGTGLVNLGTVGKPDRVPFPPWSEENLIARVDACGLCFSDIKLISAGNTHPRIEGRDLAADPTVPGHEVSLTIVGVGEKWKGKFKLGSRWILQADIYVNGKGMAFGYAIPGGLSQYVVLGREVLAGDEGCYLLPVREDTGLVEAALVEPWTCVIASYQIRARTAPRTGGVLYVTGAPTGEVELQLDGLEQAKFQAVISDRLSAPNARHVKELAGRVGLTPQDAEVLGRLHPTDVLIAGTPDRERFARIVELADANAVIAIHTSSPKGDLPLDVGRVHYRNLRLVGATDGAVLASYRHNPRETLKPAGSAWFVGGAGPMGTMHVIKAAMDPAGPARMLVSDLSDERLANLEHLIRLIATKGGRKVDLVFRNARKLGSEELSSWGGFDDIVGLVPVPNVISDSAAWLGREALFNIFAGVKVGTIAEIPLAAIVEKRARITGSSGSPLAAMRDTLALTESGRLSTELSLAAVGDMDSVSRGLQALMDNTYPGKVVIFPFAEGTGLKSIPELAREAPEIAPLLLDGRYWSREAEKRLLATRFFSSGRRSLRG